MLIPVLALISTHAVGSMLLVVVFALIGCHISGTGIGFNNYLLEIAPVPLRPAYIAISGTLAGLSYLLPIAGGVMVDLWGYQAAFTTTAVVATSGVLFSMTLKCVRRGGGRIQECEEEGRE